MLIFTIFTTSTSVGQELYYEQFTDLDGLPSMMTYEMVQDSQGVLWVGTENGLVSYDGEIFKRYSHPKLIDNDIIEIALGNDGTVYFINLSYQLAYLKDDVVQKVNTDDIGGKVINVIATPKSQYLLVRDENFNFSTKEIILSEKGEISFKLVDINSFYFDNDIFIPAISTNHEGGRRELKFDSQELKFGYVKYNKLAKLTNRDEYLYPANHKIFLIVDSIVHEFVEHKDFARIKKTKGKTFVLFNNGVLLFDERTRQVHSILETKTMNSVFVDKEGSIWFSTPTEGLIKIPFLDFQIESASNFVIDDLGISDIFLAENGIKYLGTTDGKILIYSDDNTLIKKESVSLKTRPIKFHNNGDKLYGISGLTFFEINKRTHSIEFVETKEMALKSIMLNDSILYVGTRSGLQILDYDNLQNLQDGGKKNREFEGYWINEILFNEQKDKLYLGTSIGLYVRDNKGNYSPVSVEGLDEVNISCLIHGKENSIWIGTRSKGVFRLKDDRIIEKFNVSNGLPSNNVNDILIENEQLVVSTLDGVGIKFLESGELKTIRELPGIIPKEIFVTKLIDNDYWLGTNSGLSIVASDKLGYFKRGGPILSLKSFYANGEKMDYSDNLSFSHKINSILINFQNVSLQNGKNKSIKYRISSDKTWSISSDPFIRLQALKHGKYTIDAVGINSLNDEGNKISLSFTIRPPWWQTFWARLLGLILLVALVWVIVKNRSIRIRKEELVKRNYLTQINNIKEQALQLQMNPHFIFNSLNAIQNFIGSDNEELAMNYLARFARLIRLIFEYSKGSSISLEEEIEFMGLYLDLEKLRFKDKVNIHVEISPEVESSKDFINIPPLLIQPIVENSFKHGLFHKKGKGNLNIAYTIKGNLLEVTIEDDGIGRKQAMAITQENFEKQSSSGIKTTQERINLLNFGKETSQNNILIEDLYFEDGSSAGTKTILSLAF